MDLSEYKTPKSGKTKKILIVLLVIVCLAMLAYMLILNFFFGYDHTKKKRLATETLMKNLDEALDKYVDENPFGRYPDASSEQDGNGTSILVSELVWNNIFHFYESNLSRKNPQQLVDYWGNPMRYQPWKNEAITENAHNRYSYDLWSAGADGEFGTADDITNWAVSVEEESNN